MSNPKRAGKAVRLHDSPPVKVAGFLAEIADQPQLIAASLGTIAVGLLTKRGDLIRGGSRMLAAHLLATAAKSAIKHRIDRSRPTLKAGNPELNSLPAGAVAVSPASAGNHHLSDMVAGAAVGWLSEAVVSAVFDRIEPKVERALSSRRR